MNLSRKRFFARFGFPLAGLLALAGAGVLQAGSAKFAPRQVTLADPSFDRYLSMPMLSQAWTYKNAPLLADLGLQLAEGERVLFRSRNGITSDQVLAMAAKVAAEKKDVKTLDRLAKALEVLKKTDLAAQVASAQKLAMVSRAPDAALAVPVDKMPPEVFLLFRDTLDSITDAKIAGDGETLDIIAQLAPTMTRIPEAQRKYLIKMATQARAALPAEGDPDAEALNKLLEGSRDPGDRSNPTLEGAKLGVKYDPTPKGLRIVGFMDAGPTALAKGAKLSKGDLILRVGKQACYGNEPNLDAMVRGAYKSGDRKMLVYVAKTHQIQTFELPGMQQTVPTTPKLVGVEPVSEPK